MRVAVIGAGPAGLVTLKYLATAHRFLDTDPVEVMLFEKEDYVGGTFVGRTYEDAELVSSKQLTTFSDFRASKFSEDFLSAAQYVEYLQDYCEHFQLWRCINLRSPVLDISRGRGGAGHVVRYRQPNGVEKTWHCDAVAICSGLHVVPNIPHIEGIEKVPLALHSSRFKGRSQFGEAKNILVLGSGETGADVAYMAVTAPTKRVVLCHNDGFHLAPKRIPHPYILPRLLGKPDRVYMDVPIDVSRTSLFDTFCVPRSLRNSMALWYYYDLHVKSMLWWTYGTTKGMDQWIGGVSDGRDRVWKLFFNKTGARLSPYLSYHWRPKVASGWLERTRQLICQGPDPIDTGGRSVDLAPWPEGIDADGVVHFGDNGRPEFERMSGARFRPDIVVFCTGYTQDFDLLKPKTKRPLKGAEARPYPTAAQADVRSIWSRADPTVAFIGFVRPALGAIPPLAEMQAQLWVSRLLLCPLANEKAEPSRMSPLRADDEVHYKLLPGKSARVQYGVDHESYAFQLALDMGSAPSLAQTVALAWAARRWATAWKLLVMWLLAANVNTKFRLVGPWAWDGAVHVLTADELWETVTRRHWFFGHFTMSILPILVFGPISFVVWLYAAFTSLLTFSKPASRGLAGGHGEDGEGHGEV